MAAASSSMSPSSAWGSMAMSVHLISSSSMSLQLIDILGSSTEILSSLSSASSSEDEAVLLLMIGVRAGDGIGEGSGVGSSLIGERHLLIVLGISNSMVGGCSKLPLLGVLCALSVSRTGTSIEFCAACRCIIGLSGAPLENDTGVGIEEVEDSSSPTMSSWGLEAVGVVEGDTLREEGRFAPAELDEKLRNIANMESALAGFWRPLGRRLLRLVLRRSEILELNTDIAKSELVSESLP